jgi:diacylglycerol kinase
MYIFRLITRFAHAFHGLWFAIRKDAGYKSQVYGGALLVLTLFFLFEPFTLTEILFVALGWTLLMVTELQNSALELALDRLHPELHDTIGTSKDLAAGAVLTAAGFMGVVVLVLGYSRFYYLLF